MRSADPDHNKNRPIYKGVGKSHAPPTTSQLSFIAKLSEALDVDLGYVPVTQREAEYVIDDLLWMEKQAKKRARKRAALRDG